MGLEDFSPVASVLSSVIGGISSASSSNRALRQQYRMFREANEFNAKQAQLNRDFQTNERLATQSFNSPLSQRAQLAAAGLPVTDTSGGSSVAAQPSSASSGDVASSAAPPTVTPAQPFDFSSVVSDALQAAAVSAQIRRLDSQTRLEEQNQKHNQFMDKSRFTLEQHEDLRAEDMHSRAVELADKQIENATEELTSREWHNFIQPVLDSDQHQLNQRQLKSFDEHYVATMTQIDKEFEAAMAAVAQAETDSERRYILGIAANQINRYVAENARTMDEATARFYRQQIKLGVRRIESDESMQRRMIRFQRSEGRKSRDTQERGQNMSLISTAVHSLSNMLIFK